MYTEKEILDLKERKLELETQLQQAFNTVPDILKRISTNDLDYLYFNHSDNFEKYYNLVYAYLNITLKLKSL